jgi:hypothetical protein
VRCRDIAHDLTGRDRANVCSCDDDFAINAGLVAAADIWTITVGDATDTKSADRRKPVGVAAACVLVLQQEHANLGVISLNVHKLDDTQGHKLMSAAAAASAYIGDDISRMSNEAWYLLRGIYLKRG